MSHFLLFLWIAAANLGQAVPLRSGGGIALFSCVGGRGFLRATVGECAVRQLSTLPFVSVWTASLEPLFKFAELPSNRTAKAHRPRSLLFRI